MPKFSVGKPFSVSLISGIEKVWMRGGGGVGVSRFSVEIFLSQSAENFCRGNLVCCFSESFQEQKILWIRGGEESIKLFRQKISCLTVPKISVGEPFCAAFQKSAASEKVNG